MCMLLSSAGDQCGALLSALCTPTQLACCQPPMLLQVAMLTWSYFAALLTDPGEVPVGWHPFPDDAVRQLLTAGSGARIHMQSSHQMLLAGRTAVVGMLSGSITCSKP